MLDDKEHYSIMSKKNLSFCISLDSNLLLSLESRLLFSFSVFGGQRSFSWGCLTTQWNKPWRRTCLCCLLILLCWRRVDWGAEMIGCSVFFLIFSVDSQAGDSLDGRRQVTPRVVCVFLYDKDDLCISMVRASPCGGLLYLLRCFSSYTSAHKRQLLWDNWRCWQTEEDK